MNIYISSYNKSKTITILDIDRKGKITKRSECENPSFPSYLKKYNENLYVSLKKDDEESISGILEYKIIDKHIIKNKLYKSDFSFTHLYVDSKYIIGASYHQGVIEIFEKESSLSFTKKYNNSKIHNVGYIDRIDKYYAVDLANDCIYFFGIKNTSIINEQIVYLDKNDSPRHIWYQSMNRYIYIVNENSSTIVVLDIDNNFEMIQKIPTKHSEKPNMPAAIMGDMKNEFLYVSNRGCDNVVCYKIDKKTGLLKYKFSIDNICNIPRDFFIKQDMMFIANQGSNSLISLKLESRKNSYKILQKIYIEKPVCIEI